MLYVDSDVYGPKAVSKVFQVSIPEKLLRKVECDAGSQVHCAMSKEHPGIIYLFAADRVKARGRQ